MAGVKGRSGGANRKPTAQLKVTGGYRAERHKNRADVAVPRAIIKPPRGMGKIGKEVWNRFLENLPEALITNLDLNSLAQFCEALELYDKIKVRFYNDPFDREARLIWKDVCAQVDRLGRQFGWTPQSRASLSLPAKETKDESAFSSLLSRMSGTN
jgi:P27 family predicted phage terminase small subunit